MKTKPLIALVGRPNVGKSTFFNALTKRRQALVADFSGVTRDRRFGEAEVDSRLGCKVRVVDTGGWMPKAYRESVADPELLAKIEEQVLQALDEAVLVLQVVDARAGLSPLDQDIGNFLRKRGRPFLIVANKVDQQGKTFLEHEFHSLGAKAVVPLSSEHRLGFPELWDEILPFIDADLEPEDNTREKDTIHVCIVGRPNVGKSSLLNRFVGKDRSVASSRPGTTTDPVDEEIEIDGQRFIIVDTAGIRRPSKRENDVEDLGVMYAKRNLNQADFAILVLDAEEGMTTMDGTIASLVEESGAAAVILANKWDNAPANIRQAGDAVKKFAESVHKHVPMLDFAPVVAVSAVEGIVYGAAEGKNAEGADPVEMPKTLEDIWSLARFFMQAREQKIAAEELQDFVEMALSRNEFLVRETGELRRAHQVGNRPPQFLVKVKDANKVTQSLRRFLSRSIRARYGFPGSPIRWVFKHYSGNN